MNLCGAPPSQLHIPSASAHVLREPPPPHKKETVFVLVPLEMFGLPVSFEVQCGSIPRTTKWASAAWTFPIACRGSDLDPFIPPEELWLCLRRNGQLLLAACGNPSAL